MKQHKIAIFFIIFLTCILVVGIFFNIFVGPILIGFLVAYLLNPSITYLERRGISRNTSAIVSIIVILLLLSTFVSIVLPIVIAQIKTIVDHLPDFRNLIDQKIFPKIQTFFDRFGGTSGETWTVHSIVQVDYQKISNTLIHSVGEGTKFVVSSMLFIITVPIFIFVFIKHLPRYYIYIQSTVPNSVRSAFIDFFSEVDKKLRTVLRGQILVVLIMACLYPIAFLIAGLPAAIAIGILVGLARIVPGLDTITGLVLGSIVLMSSSSSYSVIFSSILAFACLQAFDMFFINPRIMGKFAGLHPLLIIISVVVFGYWFGISGVLLAIPTVTILKVATQKLLAGYKKTAFFKL